MIISMTGYGEAAGELALPGATVSWRWEIKGVNARGLDIKLRLPPGLDHLDKDCRTILSEGVSRGTLHVGLQTDREGSAARLTVNEDALDAVIAAAKTIERKAGGAPVSTDALLGAKGVLDIADESLSDEDQSRLDERVLASLREATTAFATSRQAEGHQLRSVLDGQLDEMTALVGQARALATNAMPRHLEQIRSKISDLISGEFSADRVEQEAVLLAVKSDTREELDRLDGHLAAVRDILGKDGPAGRKLDFLAQEFGREANTLTSKAPDLDTKRVGIDLKLVVDRFREQVQNIE